jgi:NosR/NirI family transcriptional regulator, nitrous oxide reductase regulator
VCPIGAIQNVAQGLSDSAYTVPFFIVLFFVLPLVFTLFFGRTYCASVCPHGVLQDLLALRTVRVPRWLEAGLGFLPHVYLGLAVLFAVTGSLYVICRYDPFISLFRREGPAYLFLLGAAVLAVSLLVGRPYCRFVCPMSVLFNACSRLTWRHVSITPDVCIRCRLCEDACPFDAIEKPVPAELRRDRQAGRRRLGAALALLPVLVAGGVWIGNRVSDALALQNRTVLLAEEVRGEELTGALPPAEIGPSAGVSPAAEMSAVFRATGAARATLYRDAERVRFRFRWGSRALGGYLGLVLGMMAVGAVRRRPRADYEAHRGRCVACGRCFRYCPIEWARLRGTHESP